MQPPLTLTEQERLCFMQALHAVAWRDGGPTNVWCGLLERFGRLLNVPDNQSVFRAGPPGIAEKVNQIADPRARLYFLRIIHDVHRHDMDTRVFGDWGTDSRAVTFVRLYNQLVQAVHTGWCTLV